jgi:hypothetical protein
MTRYHYTVNVSADRANLEMFEGDDKVASSIVMLPAGNFESYSVNARFQGRGLSYALTHLMLLYARDAGIQNPTVSDAHNHLLVSLPRSGFAQVGALRVTKGGRMTAASFSCPSVAQALDICKRKLLASGLIADGLRNAGPYQWRT